MPSKLIKNAIEDRPRSPANVGWMLLVLFTLSACGNKGDLYLPEKPNDEKTEEVKQEQNDQSD